MIKYKRVLLKLSGEALMGKAPGVHDIQVLRRISQDIKEVLDLGVEVCVIVGGGNIFRGSSASSLGMERAAADYIGMLGTVINALTLQSVMENLGMVTRVLTALPISSICEPYIRRRAKRHIEKKRIVIFAAGSGNPFFTTDTPAVLRAIEMNCDLLLKGTQVDGVYSSDPSKNSDAIRYSQITYQYVLANNLKVMDLAAIALAQENNLPIKVFSIGEAGNFARVLKGEGVFTLIKNT